MKTLLKLLYFSLLLSSLLIGSGMKGVVNNMNSQFDKTSYSVNGAKNKILTDESLSVVSGIKNDVSHNEYFLQSEYDSNACSHVNCHVWVRIVKSSQRLYLYIDGTLIDTFQVSTGITHYETPLIDKHPSGPTYEKYTSRKFPGGNYMGLGNMPYAIFISGGYAVHGTTQGNFSKLGRKASHGCIRLHPTNAKILFDYVKQYGLKHTWVTIQEKE